MLVRVYEFAREKGMISKDVVAICQGLGMEVKAQSKLNVIQIEVLNCYFNQTQSNVTFETVPTEVVQPTISKESVTGEETITEKIVLEETEEVITEEIVLEETKEEEVAEEIVLEETKEEIVAEEIVLEEIKEEAVAEEIVLEETKEEVVAEEIVLEETEEAETEEIVAEEIVLEETILEEIEKEEAINFVAFVVSECEPFTNIGELGKKSIEFIEKTKADGNQPLIILPKYKMINENLTHLMDIDVQMGSNEHQAKLFSLVKEDVNYLFIENEHYFTRENIYGYDDDIERFTFFNRSILKSLPLIDMSITEFHLNDWQMSMFSLLLKVEYSKNPFYNQIKTVLNIHDLNHQGWCDPNYVFEVLGINEQYYNNGLIRMGDAVNLLKSGIETVDRINLTKLSEMQMKCAEMVESGISSVLERNLEEKAV